MDELRPERYEDEIEADEAETPPLDAAVVDRLAAYGQDTVPAPEMSLQPEATYSPEPAYPERFTYEHQHEDSAVEMVSGPDDVVVEPEPDTEPTVAEHETFSVAVQSDAEVEAAGEPEPPGDIVLETDYALDVAPDAPEADDAAFLVVAEEQETARRFGRRRSAGEKQRPAKERKDKRPKKLVGLKIGASQIAAAQVVNNGAPELVEAFREPLEPGLVLSGEIRDPDTLGAALKRFFELHKLPKRGIRLGVSNNRIGVRIFEIEGVADDQQLENAIRFRAEEVLPIPLDEAVLDYVVLDEREHDDGTVWKRILLVVAYREVVDRYLQACRRAGLQVVGIDLEAFALLRSLEPPARRDESSGALVAVAIGHDRTTIAVSTGLHCEFARVLDWGGWSLNVAIARELDRAPSEVESIKRHLSFAQETEVEGLTPEQVAKSRDGLQRALGVFARELISSLQFYQAQPGALGIGEVVLTGGAAHMDGFVDAVGEAIGVPVRFGDPFRRLKVGPHVGHEDQHGSLAIAIGLGIED